MPDSEIVASIVAGNPDGLAAAYDRYADALYKYCQSMLRDPDAPAGAVEAVQDTFLIAASRLARLDDPRRLRAWLYAVARNECMRILRSRTITPVPPETDTVIDITEGAAERARLRALLATAAAGLDPDEREVVELQLRQSLELGEVAAVLGVSGEHAHVLAARAHGQLEACLAVLLVGGARGGGARGGCDELEAMLADWDAQLTVALRKRVHPHIERCPSCSTRLALELAPAVLLGMPVGAAMAAAAAESFWLAPGAPYGLREHTLPLAARQDPAAIAHREAASVRAGTFRRDGFPKPRRHPRALAGLRSTAPAQAAMAGLRSRPGARAAMAAAVAGIAIAATAFALSGGSGSPALAGRRPPFGHAATPAGPEPTARATPTAHATRRPTARARPPATRPAATPAAPDPAPTASPRPKPAPAPQGTVSVSLGDSGPVQPGTPLTLSQDGGGTPITLTANGGVVNWSVSVSGGPPGHQVSLSGSSSGTLQPGQSAQVVLTANKAVQGATLTVNPGGAAYPLESDSQGQQALAQGQA
jgi:RNA polymerase sigma factor (sigma-70 family)